MSALQELSANVEKMFHVECKFRCDVAVLISDNATATHNVATTPTTTTATSRLAALMSESAQLERLVAAANDDGVSSGSTAALSLQMEDSLQHLDASLNSGPRVWLP